MTFIDWSDPEGMFGLLIEFVRDERNECEGDPKRRQFLSALISDLGALVEEFGLISKEEIIHRLRNIYDSLDQEFAGDPVAIHIKDCISELERSDG